MKINKITKQILFNSLAQAIIQIINTPYLIIKYFLFLFTFASTGLSFYLIAQSINDYLSYQVITTSRTIYEIPTLFPKISFCNVNWQTTEFAYNFLELNQQREEVDNEIRRKFGHHLDDILLFCLFDYKPCNSSDFVWSYDNNFGNCYTFNSGYDSNGVKTELKKSNFAGPTFGLQLTLYVNFYEELTENISYEGFEEMRGGIGAVIRIDNSTYQLDFSQDGIFVPSGFQTDVVINREFNSNLPRPYSNCEIELNSTEYQSNSEYYNLIRNSKYIYTQQLCFTQCVIQKKLIAKYNCTSSFFISLYENNSLDNNCTGETLFDDIIPNYHEYIMDECLEFCPLECYETLFRYKISSHELIGDDYILLIKNRSNLKSDFIERPIDSNTAKESFVRVNIYYGQMSYTLSNESPKMNIISLLSSIGGYLSLFLGISAFSICELVELLIKKLYD
jgi:hypothetical protein